MTVWGVDYSEGLDINVLTQYHAIFACRYVGYTSPGLPQTKILTLSEATTLSNNNIAIVSNWEWTANRASEGFNAGVWDAQTAAALHAQCGGPADRPIYFSVDYNTDGTDTFAYFQGVASVIGLGRVGAYAPYAAINNLLNGGYIAWAWQTYAWSGSLFDSRNHIYQYLNGATLGDMTVDYDNAYPLDYGQWYVGGKGNVFTEQAIKDEFLSFNKYMQTILPTANIPTLRTDTGIYQTYHDLFMKGIQLGAATSDEYVSVTGTGAPITYQNFGSYRIGWIMNVGPNGVYGPTTIPLP